MHAYFQNLLRPWKIVTCVIGTSFFVWGAYFWAVPTWDVGVSLLMSALCFLLAPWAVDLAVRAMKRRSGTWKRDLLVSTATVYFVASGSYEIYNTVRMGSHPVTYWYNLGFSVPVTIIAGALWRYDGSLRDFARAVREAAEASKTAP